MMDGLLLKNILNHDGFTVHKEIGLEERVSL